MSTGERPPLPRSTSSAIALSTSVVTCPRHAFDPQPRLPLVLRLAAWLSRRQHGRALAIIPYVCLWLLGLRLATSRPRSAREPRPSACAAPPSSRRGARVGRERVLVLRWTCTPHSPWREGDAPSLLVAPRGVSNERDSFTPPEKGRALAWVEEIARSRGAEAETLSSLRAHFGDREIVALSWLASFTTYLNTLAKALGLASQGICEVVIARRASARRQ